MQVGFYATLRPIVGARRVEVPLPDRATVQDLLDELLRRWPALEEPLLDEDGSLSRHVNVFVDGRGTRWLPEGTATSLDGVERVDVFPAVAGGCEPW